MARTLVISNRKGGTGKSSASVNLAAEMAARGKRVLLIDLDTQGHCAVGLGIRPARQAPSLHGFLAGNNSLRQAVVASPWSGLHLIAADTLAEHGLGGQRELLLREGLLAEQLVDDYDLIVLDSPPSHDALLLNALCAADRVLVPFVPHFLSAQGVQQLARVLFKLASSGHNERLRVLGFLPVMVDARVLQHREVHARLAHQFGAARMLPGIRNDIRVAEAFAAGKPVREYAPHSRAAADYAAVTTAVDGLWP